MKDTNEKIFPGLTVISLHKVGLVGKKTHVFTLIFKREFTIHSQTKEIMILEYGQ